MAPRDDETYRQKKEREEELEAEKRAEEEELLKKQGQSNKAGAISGSTEKINELIGLAEPMIEQLNNLYNRFLAGAEKIPPNEQRKRLDQLMNTVQIMTKPTGAIQFKCNTLYAHYVSFRDRWDKQMRDLEVGKIRRR